MDGFFNEKKYLMLNKLSLKVRPNNQITLTYGNFKDNSKTYKPVQLLEDQFDKHDKLRRSRILRRLEERRRPKVDWRGRPIKPTPKPPLPPLDLMKKSQRGPRVYAENKPKSFTRAAGQHLRECGAAMDAIASDPRFCHAITLTLPANHEHAFKTLSVYSGYAINRLFQRIRRLYGHLCHWFFVWEYQRRGALHCHIALYHPDESEGLWISTQIIELWHKILEDIQKKSGVDMFCRRDLKTYTPREKHQHHCQPMQKGLGQYFAKYAGKKESKQAWYCQKYPVSRFWGCSRNLKMVIRSLSFELKICIDDSSHIEWIVKEINRRLTTIDAKCKYKYDFYITKAYDSSCELVLADGTRVSYYCPKDMLVDALTMFSDLSGSF